MNDNLLVFAACATALFTGIIAYMECLRHKHDSDVSIKQDDQGLYAVSVCLSPGMFSLKLVSIDIRCEIWGYPRAQFADYKPSPTPHALDKYCGLFIAKGQPPETINFHVKTPDGKPPVVRLKQSWFSPKCRLLIY